MMADTDNANATDLVDLDPELYIETAILDTNSQHLGGKFSSIKQKNLFEEISKIDKLLFTLGPSNNLTLDCYGKVQIQSIGGEDRLYFPNNKMHVHVNWSEIYCCKNIKYTEMPKNRIWKGIGFYNRSDIMTFSIFQMLNTPPLTKELLSLVGSLL